MKLKLPIGKHEGNGSKLFLTAYKNIDKDYDFEMFIDVEDEKGCFVRQIAVVRPTYKHVNHKAVPNDGPYELLLDDGTNSDFDAVQMPGRTDEVIPVRESAERGMVPHHSDNAPLDLVMTPSRSGLALCARLTSNPGELYIGLVDLKHNGVWWQNIARFHDGGGALPSVIVDLFSEMTRGYDAHKAYTIR